MNSDGAVVSSLFLGVLFAFLLVGGVHTCTSPDRGRDGGDCFPNHTCHTGLSCYSAKAVYGVCIDPKTLKINGKDVNGGMP